jgi:hypothetical protein
MSLGRNDECHCGSGRKYKKCHLAADAAERKAPTSEGLKAIVRRAGYFPVEFLGCVGFDPQLAAGERATAVGARMATAGLTEAHGFPTANETPTGQAMFYWPEWCWNGDRHADAGAAERSRRSSAPASVQPEAAAMFAPELRGSLTGFPPAFLETMQATSGASLSVAGLNLVLTHSNGPMTGWTLSVKTADGRPVTGDQVFSFLTVPQSKWSPFGMPGYWTTQASPGPDSGAN